MERPDPTQNIYPRTVKNIKAILEFYFPYKTHTEILEAAISIHEKRGVALNQLEFTAKFVQLHLKEISKIIGSRNLLNLIRDTRDALFVTSEEWEIKNGTHTPKLQALAEWVNKNQ